MPAVDIVIKAKPPESLRARQVCSMFDIPPDQSEKLQWSGEVPIDEKDWNIGMIVGPSGCGKTTIAKDMFGGLVTNSPEWQSASLVDDFPENLPLSKITEALSSVGLNTIPAWIRPYETLSNGEKFRADMARMVASPNDLSVVDEFTSVVDRQVAKIGAFALQKRIRKLGKKFVAVSCHYDIEDWLRPDWVLEPATMTFAWRSLRPRPSIKLTIRKVKRSHWQKFSRYHYMSATLVNSAQCYGAFVDGNIVGFAAYIHFPHAKRKNIKRVTRLVVLPDWQGLGISFALGDTMASAYKATGIDVRHYPAHPGFIRSHQKHKLWKQTKKGGTFATRSDYRRKKKSSTTNVDKARPCAVFEYAGPPMEKAKAESLINAVPI